MKKRLKFLPYDAYRGVTSSEIPVDEQIYQEAAFRALQGRPRLEMVFLLPNDWFMLAIKLGHPQPPPDEFRNSEIDFYQLATSSGYVKVGRCRRDTRD